MSRNSDIYEQDFYTWTQTTAALMRAGQGQDLKPPRDRAWTAPVTVISTLACLLVVMIGMTGCAAIAAQPLTLPSGPAGSGPTSVLTLTEVHLQQRNYRVIRLNVTGTSRGFALLGLLMLKPPDAAEAFASLDQRGHAVPFTTQTRLTFEVVLPLWGHRGPHPTPPVDVHHGRRSAKERQRS